jgi:transposase-like protein
MRRPRLTLQPIAAPQEDKIIAAESVTRDIPPCAAEHVYRAVRAGRLGESEARELIAVTPLDERALLDAGFRREEIAAIIEYRREILDHFERLLREAPPIRRQTFRRGPRTAQTVQASSGGSSFNHRVKINAEKRETVIEMLRAGVSTSAIARHFDVSAKHIRTIRSEAGLARRPATKHAGIYCPEALI